MNRRFCSDRLFAAVAGVALLGNWAAGASLTWDASGTSASAPVDGAGIWDTATSHWSDGSSDNTWVNANNDTAVFGNGGSPATVSLGSDIAAGGITFNSAYIIDANSHR